MTIMTSSPGRARELLKAAKLAIGVASQAEVAERAAREAAHEAQHASQEAADAMAGIRAQIVDVDAKRATVAYELDHLLASVLLDGATPDTRRESRLIGERTRLEATLRVLTERAEAAERVRSDTSMVASAAWSALQAATDALDAGRIRISNTEFEASQLGPIVQPYGREEAPE